MNIFISMKGALVKMANALSPQKKWIPSIMSRKKYVSEISKIKNSNSSSSILGMAKYDTDSGVVRNEQRKTSTRKKK